MLLWQLGAPRGVHVYILDPLFAWCQHSLSFVCVLYGTEGKKNSPRQHFFSFFFGACSPEWGLQFAAKIINACHPPTAPTTTTPLCLSGLSRRKWSYKDDIRSTVSFARQREKAAAHSWRPPFTGPEARGRQRDWGGRIVLQSRPWREGAATHGSIGRRREPPKSCTLELVLFEKFKIYCEVLVVKTRKFDSLLNSVRENYMMGIGDCEARWELFLW